MMIVFHWMKIRLVVGKITERKKAYNGRLCKSCFPCLFRVLYDFRRNSTFYADLFSVYKYEIT